MYQNVNFSVNTTNQKLFQCYNKILNYLCVHLLIMYYIRAICVDSIIIIIIIKADVIELCFVEFGTIEPLNGCDVQSSLSCVGPIFFQN